MIEYLMGHILLFMPIIPFDYYWFFFIGLEMKAPLPKVWVDKHKLEFNLMPAFSTNHKIYFMHQLLHYYCYLVI